MKTRYEACFFLAIYINYAIMVLTKYFDVQNK